MTSKNIMYVKKFKDSIMLRAACDCMDESDDITIDIESIDDEYIEMTFYKKLYLTDYRPIPESIKDHFNNIKYRLKNAIKLIFTGRVDVESGFLFCGEEQIEDFIKTLNEAKEYVKENCK